MKYPIFYCFLFFCTMVFGQNKFAVSNIPAELLINADQVVLLYELNYDLKNRGEAIETEHKVVTLLNKKAENELEKAFGYDDFNKIVEIDAFVYQADGKLFKHLKKKDIEDVLAFQGFKFVSDARMKLVHFPRLAWPFTIEYKVVTKTKNTMFLPEFQPQNKLRQSVWEATFHISHPEDFPKINFLEQNMPKNAKTSALGWHFHDLKAIQYEAFAPLNQLSVPRVVTAPTEFKVGEFEGSMDSWQSFGQFIQKLNSTQGELPADFIQELREMVANCATDSCKIERIYHFLQENTRYFYVGMGIGGWQPKAAGEVNASKFGDCKALSNYTVAMLRAVGVAANYALIRAGQDERFGQFPDFPNAHFNHAVVCVPSKTDTFWLECTSQTQSFGFAGDFTDSRDALIIDEKGGFLVKTPKYDEKTNTCNRKVDILIDETGHATLKSESEMTGILQESVANLMLESKENQQKAIYDNYNIHDFTINKIDFEQKKGRLPAMKLRLELEMLHLGSVSGKRIFVPISMFASTFQPENLSETRIFPIQITERSFSENTLFTFSLPEGYVLESPVPPVLLESIFGSFELRTVSEANTVSVTQKLVLKDTVQPAERWLECQNFQKSMAKTLNSKLVFVKKT